MACLILTSPPQGLGVLCADQVGAGEMQGKGETDDFPSRAAKVREIAEGIFDKDEREFIIRFVNDCEKIVTPRAEKRSSHR